MSVPELNYSLEIHVVHARLAYNHGATEAATKLRDASVSILEQLLIQLREKEAAVSYGKSRQPVPPLLVSRLVKELGSAEAAEDWYNCPSSCLRGMTPAEKVGRDGMDWLLDANCNWGLLIPDVLEQ